MRAALAGRHAADHLGAVGDRLLGVEGALAPVMPWQMTLVFLSTRMDISAASFTAVDDLLGGIVEVVGGDDVEPDLARILLAELDIGAFEAHHQRHLEADLLHRRDDAFGDDVASHDAAEDVDQDALHLAGRR